MRRSGICRSYTNTRNGSKVDRRVLAQLRLRADASGAELRHQAFSSQTLLPDLFCHPIRLLYPPGANVGTATDLTWPIPADSTSVNPDDKGKVTTDEFIANNVHNKISINVIWTLITDDSGRGPKGV